MQTSALMGISVLLSVIFGVLIGIWCSQVIKTGLHKTYFGYNASDASLCLFTACYIFGIGGPPAILASMIYAMPPIIRLSTNLGIRQVPHETIETIFWLYEISNAYKAQTFCTWLCQAL